MIEAEQAFSFPFVYLYAASMVLCLYAAYCELFEKLISDNILLVFLGIGLVAHSIFGGLGDFLLNAPSLVYSFVGLLLGLFFYLPFLKYYKKQHAFLFFWLSLGAILGPFHFLYVYFYTCLVCALLSILLIVKRSVFSKPIEISLDSEESEEIVKNKKELGRVQAPYYISSIFGVLITWLGWY